MKNWDRQKIIRFISLLAILILIITITMVSINDIFLRGKYNESVGVQLQKTEAFKVENMKVSDVLYDEEKEELTFNYKMDIYSERTSVLDIESVKVLNTYLGFGKNILGLDNNYNSTWYRETDNINTKIEKKEKDQKAYIEVSGTYKKEKMNKETYPTFLRKVKENEDILLKKLEIEITNIPNMGYAKYINENGIMKALSGVNTNNNKQKEIIEISQIEEENK